MTRALGMGVTLLWLAACGPGVPPIEDQGTRGEATGSDSETAASRTTTSAASTDSADSTDSAGTEASDATGSASSSTGDDFPDECRLNDETQMPFWVEVADWPSSLVLTGASCSMRSSIEREDWVAVLDCLDEEGVEHEIVIRAAIPDGHIVPTEVEQPVVLWMDYYRGVTGTWDFGTWLRIADPSDATLVAWFKQGPPDFFPWNEFVPPLVPGVTVSPFEWDCDFETFPSHRVMAFSFSTELEEVILLPRESALLAGLVLHLHEGTTTCALEDPHSWCGEGLRFYALPAAGT
jgi:hypothetical protein